MDLNQAPGTSRRPDTKPASNQMRYLREEIRFWQELLSVMESTEHTSESVERVRQALALAQYRLALVLPQSSH